jgi:hypothetical protein
MADKTNGPRLTSESRSQTTTKTTVKSTGRCECPRSGDLWLCAGRPDMVAHPDGRRCELGALVRLGTDHDVRGELTAMLAAGGGDR